MEWIIRIILFGAGGALGYYIGHRGVKKVLYDVERLAIEGGDEAKALWSELLKKYGGK